MGTQTVVDVRPHRTPSILLGDAIGGAPGEAGRIRISGVANATALLRPGDLFAALPGAAHHGAEFAAEAVARGAAAVLTDPAGDAIIRRTPGLPDVPVVVVADPRRELGAVSARIYGNADSRVRAFGVTGTNGKTTVTYYGEALLAASGFVTGLSATPERHVGATLVGSGLTTPEAPVLQGMIARMRELGATALALEVSAQAVSKHRIAGTRFDVVGFMNLSPEHLDEYPGMEAYYQAKRGLFTPEYADRAVIALSDRWGERLAAECAVPVEVLRASWWEKPGAEHVGPSWEVTDFLDTDEGCACTVVAPGGYRFRVRAGLPGRHVAVDAAMAIALVSAIGVPPEAVQAALDGGALAEVYIPGRLEQISVGTKPLAIVDYAHTPAAMADTLVELRRRTTGRLITAFGADGGRDPFKRPGMAEAAASVADLVIICDAHPRLEDPAEIRAQLRAAADALHAAEVVEIADPAEAIRYAVAQLDRDDTFVVLGPGDEDYRAVGEREIPYSARDEVRSALAVHGIPARPPMREGVGR